MIYSFHSTGKRGGGGGGGWTIEWGEQKKWLLGGQTDGEDIDRCWRHGPPYFLSFLPTGFSHESASLLFSMDVGWDGMGSVKMSGRLHHRWERGRGRAIQPWGRRRGDREGERSHPGFNQQIDPPQMTEHEETAALLKQHTAHRTHILAQCLPRGPTDSQPPSSPSPTLATLDTSQSLTLAHAHSHLPGHLNHSSDRSRFILSPYPSLT